MSKRRNLTDHTAESKLYFKSDKVENETADDKVKDNNSNGELLEMATIDHFAKELY